MYGARDVSSTSLFVIASVTERSFFHALHIHNAAKSTISINSRSKYAKLEKNLLSCPVALYVIRVYNMYGK